MCLLIVYRGQIYLEKRITLFFIKNFVAEALALFHCVDCTSGNIIMGSGTVEIHCYAQKKLQTWDRTDNNGSCGERTPKLNFPLHRFY